MLRLFDFVVNQGGPVEVVFRMLANLAPHYMGLALPIGIFLGILLAFRKLSLSSEFDALNSSGLSLLKQVRPALVLTLFLMIVNIILVGWIQPHSRYAYRGLVFDLRSGALGASIQVGEFVELGDDIVLRIEESRNQGADLHGIFLERRNDRNSIAVTAQRGGFFATNDDQTILLRLFDGKLMDFNESQNKPRVLTFDQQDLTIKLPEDKPFRDRGGEQLEMTLPELWVESTNSDRTLEERQAIRANLHWRAMHSLTFLVIPFLAIPMGLMNKRSGKGAGLVVGISLMVVYNELMEGMETAVAGGASPYVTIWVLYGAFAALSFWMFRIAAFKVGGEPLFWVDRIADATSAPVARFTKRLLGVSK